MSVLGCVVQLMWRGCICFGLAIAQAGKKTPVLVPAERRVNMEEYSVIPEALEKNLFGEVGAPLTTKSPVHLRQTLLLAKKYQEDPGKMHKLVIELALRGMLDSSETFCDYKIERVIRSAATRSNTEAMVKHRLASIAILARGVKNLSVIPDEVYTHYTLMFEAPKKPASLSKENSKEAPSRGSRREVECWAPEVRPGGEKRSPGVRKWNSLLAKLLVVHGEDSRPAFDFERTGSLETIQLVFHTSGTDFPPAMLAMSSQEINRNNGSETSLALIHFTSPLLHPASVASRRHTHYQSVYGRVSAPPSGVQQSWDTFNTPVRNLPMMGLSDIGLSLYSRGLITFAIVITQNPPSPQLLQTVGDLIVNSAQIVWVNLDFKDGDPKHHTKSTLAALKTGSLWLRNGLGILRDIFDASHRAWEADTEQYFADLVKTLPEVSGPAAISILRNRAEKGQYCLTGSGAAGALELDASGFPVLPNKSANTCVPPWTQARTTKSHIFGHAVLRLPCVTSLSVVASRGAQGDKFTAADFHEFLGKVESCLPLTKPTHRNGVMVMYDEGDRLASDAASFLSKTFSRTMGVNNLVDKADRESKARQFEGTGHVGYSMQLSNLSQIPYAYDPTLRRRVPQPSPDILVEALGFNRTPFSVPKKRMPSPFITNGVSVARDWLKFVFRDSVGSCLDMLNASHNNKPQFNQQQKRKISPTPFHPLTRDDDFAADVKEACNDFHSKSAALDTLFKRPFDLKT